MQEQREVDRSLYSPTQASEQEGERGLWFEPDWVAAWPALARRLIAQLLEQPALHAAFKEAP